MPPDYASYPAMAQVVNAELIWNHFGRWPAFHDAEIVKVIFETHPATGRYSITFTVEAFEMTRNVSAQGYFELAKRCLIEIQFTGIEEITFEDFRHQNVLWELKFENQGSFIACDMSSSVGMEATIVAAEAVVLSLTPAE